MNEYFIDPVNGDETNDGTITAPFRSFAPWKLRKQPGDRVVVRAGTLKGMRWAIPGVTLTADGMVTVVPPDDLPNNCLRCDVPPNTVTDLPTVIEGFTTRGGTQSGIWATCCPHVTIHHNTVYDGFIWGIHCGGADDIHVLHNKVFRTYRQHGVYITNSVNGFSVVGNVLDYLWLQGIHVNGDEDTSRGIGLANPHGTMKNGLVKDNVIRRAGWSLTFPAIPNTHRGGGGMDADACVDVRYTGNKVVNCQGWGMNVHTSQIKLSERVLVEGNVIESKWTNLNINKGSTDVTVRLNTLSNPNGSHFDLSGGAPPVNLVREENVLTRTDPYGVDFVTSLPVVDAPAVDVPPPVPPPPPVVLPPLPDTAPTATPAVRAEYDLDGDERGVLCKEWDKADRFGADFKVVSVQPPPDDFWADTIVGRFPRPDHGMRFEGCWQSPVSGVVEVWAQAQGQYDVYFGGVQLLDGSREQNQFEEEAAFLSVMAGEWYEIDTGVAGLPDTVVSLRLRYRTAGMTERKGFETTRCRPLRGIATPPPPVVPPPPPPAPTGTLFQRNPDLEDILKIIERTK